MEAISSVASVLALIGAAVRTGRETLVLVQSSRKAPVHIRRLAAELEDLEKILTGFQNLLKKFEMQSDQTVVEMLDNLKKVLSSCVNVLLDVKKNVSRFLNHNGGVVAGRWQGFVWATFKKEDVSALQETLSSYTAMLALSFSAISTLYGAHIDKMVLQIDANTSQNQNTLQHIQKAVRRLQQQVDNRDREEALRERRLQQDHGGDSDLPDGSGGRFSAAPYNNSLRTSLHDFDSIIFSSPANSRAPSMAVSMNHDSSTPSASNADSEGLETKRYSRSPLEHLDYLIEEEQLSESEGSLDLTPLSEIESDWPLRKPKISLKTLGKRVWDRPTESEPKLAKDKGKGVDHHGKTAYPALEVTSRLNVTDSARDINECGNESQLPQSHPSSPLKQSCTSSTFHREPYPLTLNAVPESMQATRDPKYLDDMDEIRRITGSLQRRTEDWKGLKLEEFGKLLLCEVLMVSRTHDRNWKRWCEVYLFEQILLCCDAKEYERTYSSLIPSERLPRLRVKGSLVMQDICGVIPILKREDRNLRVVWQSDGVVDLCDLSFKDLGTLSRWEACLEQRMASTEGGETVGAQTEGGETEGGETVGAQTEGGETEGGETEGGETEGGETEGGETEGGETEGGETEGGETEGGETEGGETGGEYLTEMPSKIHRSASWKKRRYAVAAAAAYPEAK